MLKSTFGPTLFLLYNNDLMMLSVIFLSMLMTLLCSDQGSDLWQQLELAFELESDLWNTVNWCRSGLLIQN